MEKIYTLFLLFTLLFMSCSLDNDVAEIVNPFDPASELVDSVLRNNIVVISDTNTYESKSQFDFYYINNIRT